MTKFDKVFYSCLIGFIVLFCAVMTGVVWSGHKERFNRPFKTVMLSTGDIVKCRDVWPDRCGVMLYRCQDGQEYLCQLNVKQLPSP